MTQNADVRAKDSHHRHPSGRHRHRTAKNGRSVRPRNIVCSARPYWASVRLRSRPERRLGRVFWERGYSRTVALSVGAWPGCCVPDRRRAYSWTCPAGRGRMRADSAGLDGCPFLARREDRSSGHCGQGWAGRSLTATLMHVSARRATARSRSPGALTFTGSAEAL